MTYHYFQRLVQPSLPFVSAMHPPAAEKLNQDEYIYCKSNAMMRIRQTSLGPYSEPSQYKHHSSQQNRQYLEPYVYSHCRLRISIVKPKNEDC